nr:MAG TPA: hypothetical protein [Caudoviricetes sp.]
MALLLTSLYLLKFLKKCLKMSYLVGINPTI